MGGFLPFLPLISGVVSAVGGIAQSRAQSASAEAQARAERMNAQLAGINADIAQDEGKRQQAQAAEDAYRAQGRQRAAQAEQGIINSSTGILMQDQSQREADEEQMRIGRAAEMESLQYKIQRGNALNSANILSSNTKSSRTGGLLGAAGSILGGAATSYAYHNNFFKNT